MRWRWLRAGASSSTIGIARRLTSHLAGWEWSRATPFLCRRMLTVTRWRRRADAWKASSIELQDALTRSLTRRGAANLERQIADRFADLSAVVHGGRTAHSYSPVATTQARQGTQAASA